MCFSPNDNAFSKNTQLQLWWLFHCGISLAMLTHMCCADTANTFTYDHKQSRHPLETITQQPLGKGALQRREFTFHGKEHVLESCNVRPLIYQSPSFLSTYRNDVLKVRCVIKFKQSWCHKQSSPISSLSTSRRLDQMVLNTDI